MNLTHKKLVVSGKHLEFYTFREPIAYGQKDSIHKRKKKRAKRLSESEASEESRWTSVQRTKRTLRRLIQANAGFWYQDNGKPFRLMFLTLTFKENQENIKLANSHFMRFIQRLNYFLYGVKQTKLQYVCVLEFQKRGAIHYHMIIFNLPFIKDHVYQTLLGIWRKNNGQGSIYLEPVKKLTGAIKYVSKYLMKNMNDERLFNHRKYLTSRGLKKPITFLDEGTAKAIQKLLSDDTKKYEKEIPHMPIVKTMTYTQHIINTDLRDLPLDDLSRILVDLAYKTRNQKL